MAKAKKNDGGKKNAAEKKTPAPATPAAASGVPAINTSLAAATAAAMIGNKAKAPEAADPTKKESSTFKQLKESLTKTPGQIMGDMLHQTGGGKKSNQPFGLGKQVGHNQTFGESSRRSVPRRTGGG